MRIDPGSHIPIYRQIADGIREAVAAGVYQADEPLPSLRALALEVRVNPNTVQKAYDDLAREGLIYAQRGKGLFVSPESVNGAVEKARCVVRKNFDEGIRAGRSAGLSERELRRVFNESLNSSASNTET